MRNSPDMSAPVQSADGTTVDEAARRLAPLVHLLEALSRRTGGWLEHAERLDHKVAWADHMADDARAATALRRRTAALDAALPGAPDGGTRDLLERLFACETPGEHGDTAYGVVKPAVAEACDAYLQVADPLVEMPTLSLLLAARSGQERHVADLPPRAEPLDSVHTPLTAAPGEPLAVAPVPPAAPPAREPFVRRVEERPSLDDIVDALHALLHAFVAAGERAARSHHVTGDVAAAERAAVLLRHAAVSDRLLAAAGSRWGERAVGPPHDDPYAVAQVIAVQHPATERVLGHLCSERP